MSSESWLVFDPTAPTGAATCNAPAPLERLQGKVVGIIDNSKPNFEHLAADLGELLTSRYGVARVVTQRKRSASMGASTAVLDQLARECDLVITGSGD